MPLLDNPLDTSLNGKFSRLNKMGMVSRWGWSLGWGIPPAFAIVFAATGRGGNAMALILIWLIGVLYAFRRPIGFGNVQRKQRKWLIWVALEYVMCLAVIIATLVPNP